MALKMHVGSDSDAWRNGGWTIPKQKENEITDLLEFRNQIVGQIGNLHTYIQTQSNAFRERTQEMDAEIRGLQKENHVFADRLHKVEGDLKVARETYEATKQTLRRKDQEIAGLKEMVQRQAHQTRDLNQELAHLRQKQRDQGSRVLAQQKILKETARECSKQQRLQTKQKEKRDLEDKLAQTQAAIRTKQANIVMPSAVVAGGLFALVTGGIGGLMVGFAGGTLASKAATDSAKCPCMTELHAEEASVRQRLQLVDDEIKRLEKELNPKES